MATTLSFFSPAADPCAHRAEADARVRARIRRELLDPHVDLPRRADVPADLRRSAPVGGQAAGIVGDYRLRPDLLWRLTTQPWARARRGIAVPEDGWVRRGVESGLVLACSVGMTVVALAALVAF